MIATTTPKFYGRDLTPAELAIYTRTLEMERGETIEIEGVKICRGNFSLYFYVENRSGYRCETDRLSGSVHVANLLAAYAATELVDNHSKSEKV